METNVQESNSAKSMCNPTKRERERARDWQVFARVNTVTNYRLTNCHPREEERERREREREKRERKERESENKSEHVFTK